MLYSHSGLNKQWAHSGPMGNVDREAGQVLDRNGARLLALALIERSVADLRFGGRPATAARLWFGGGKAPIGFETACDLAGLDPDAVLDRLRPLLPEAA
jgi:hypothetical protein